MAPPVAALGLACVVVIAAFAGVSADTPANCSYPDVVGVWRFHEADRVQTRSTIKCDKFDSGSAVHNFTVKLSFPNVAVDSFGNIGTWTLIYNQGFEFTVAGRKYFAWSYFTQKGKNVTSYCDRVFPGKSHDVLTNNWACYSGRRLSTGQAAVITEENVKHHEMPDYEQRVAEDEVSQMTTDDLVTELNAANLGWTAANYAEFADLTVADEVRMAGGVNSAVFGRPTVAPATAAVKAEAQRLPENFDWRNYEGRNYVGKIRHQLRCGSCYAFASTGMLEDRVRIQTNGTQNITLSPQDVVSCTDYSQGCNGGFIYLIGGKYGQDYGLVQEHCNPYLGKNTKSCNTNASCKRRHYSASYQYTGGFFGGCNEELMRIALVKDGPIGVSYEVTKHFRTYKNGIYRPPTGKKFEFNPFRELNHAVIIVGYGFDKPSQTPYWIVRNSWGEKWGEQGFFRIVRGINALGIESLAFEAITIPA